MTVHQLARSEKPAETLSEMRSRHATELEQHMQRTVEALHGLADELGVSLNDILGPRRDHETSFARHVVMWRMRSDGYSLPDIGRFFNRDHTTVLHGVRRIERMKRELAKLEGPCKA